MANASRTALLVAPILLGLLAVGFLVVRGCQEQPVGRPQVAALNAEQEARLGEQAYQQVLEKAKVLHSGSAVETVQVVTNNLARAADHAKFLQLTKLGPQEFSWDVELVDNREMNAFCLPGGKMVACTGILPLCQTEAGLATVMGHAIGHALAHHGRERMSQQQITQIGGQAAGVSLGDLDEQHRAQVMQALNSGARFGILAYSRDHESEADHLGLLLMAAAGYDPREAVRFWERMQQATKGGSTPEFLSTHPSHERRIRDLQEWIPEAMPLYEASKKQRGDRPLPLPGDR
jgi:predicted Zn-dependent protease